jgi:AraC-like DNA-binding protein
MSITHQVLYLISALGAFNGFVLSLYLLLNKKRRSIPAFFLSLLLLTISIRISNSVLAYFNPQLPNYNMQTGWSACFLIGPSLFFFLKSSINNVTQVPAAWKKHWGILGGILVAVNGVAYFLDFPVFCNVISTCIIYAQWAGYLVASGLLLKPTIQTLFKNAGSLQPVEKFRLLVLGGNITILLAYQVAMGALFKGMCMGGAISFSFFLYLTVFFYLHSANMANILQTTETPLTDKPKKRDIPESDANTWTHKLETLIRQKQLYKDPNLKLNDLARGINISSHLLSQLLNDNLGKSFSTYINEYRINEACKLIETNHHLTFEAIGYEVGFNSKSTFYTAFKKVKDTTPALFKESIEKTVHK